MRTPTHQVLWVVGRSVATDAHMCAMQSGVTSTPARARAAGVDVAIDGVPQALPANGEDPPAADLHQARRRRPDGSRLDRVPAPRRTDGSRLGTDPVDRCQ